MSLLIKVGIPCALGLSTATIIGSNAIIRNKKFIKLEKKGEDNEWDKKLNKLKSKLGHIGGSPELANKIAGDNKDHLKLQDAGGDFSDRPKAKEALQAWCDKENNNEKDLVNELCKKEENKGWLFG